MRNPIHIKVDLRLRDGSYKNLDGTPQLCLSELRRYVDMPRRAPYKAVMHLTNKQPSGPSNGYHIFRWSRSAYDWTLRQVDVSPGLYYGLQGTLNANFKKSHTVYAWLEA